MALLGEENEAVAVPKYSSVLHRKEMLNPLMLNLGNILPMTCQSKGWVCV